MYRDDEEMIYRIISEESISYLRSMDLLIDWGCYCVEYYAERTPEDNQHFVEIIYKLYHRQVGLDFFERKCPKK